MCQYRAVGHPIAVAVTEGLVELAAAKIGMDPLELRRRNLYADDAYPAQTAAGLKLEQLSHHEALAHLDAMLAGLLVDYAPDAAAVEEVFVNANPQSTLKLGQARGVVLCAAARGGIEVGEYAARLVKKAVVGTGNAEKRQVHAMVARLLPGAKIDGPDAADALAVAICHAHHLATARRIIP